MCTIILCTQISATLTGKHILFLVLYYASYLFSVPHCCTSLVATSFKWEGGHPSSFSFEHCQGNSFSTIFYFPCSFYDPGPHGNGRYTEHMLPEVEKKDFRKGAQVCQELVRCYAHCYNGSLRPFDGFEMAVRVKLYAIAEFSFWYNWRISILTRLGKNCFLWLVLKGI